MKKLSVVAFALALTPGFATAGDLVYQPVNPSFGGEAFNGTHLLNLANAQNQTNDAFSTLFEEATTADQFIAAIRSSLISGAAQAVTDSIFDNTDTSTQTITLDGAMVTFQTVDNRVVVTVDDGIETNVLDIPLPVAN